VGAPQAPWPARSSAHPLGDERIPLRVDLLVSGDPCWESNELRFLDEAEALDFAEGLCRRWLVVDHIRVVPESWVRRELYEPGSEQPRWCRPARSPSLT
jgi:hypothetical protein